MKINLFDVYCCSCLCPTCNDRDIYVGQALHGFEVRAREHRRAICLLTENRPPGKNFLRFHTFMKTHGGVENLQIRLIRRCSSKEEMDAVEIESIVVYRTWCEHGGMNFNKGGNGGSVKGLRKLSQTARQAKKQQLLAFYLENDVSNETRQKLSIARISWLEENLHKCKEHANKAQITLRNHLDNDEEFKKKYLETQAANARLGNAAMCYKLATDPLFNEEFGKKISMKLSEWCKNNPEQVKIRAQKIADSQTVEQRQAKSRKGWETRRKNNRESK